MPAEVNGFLVIDKPAGSSSFACVARVRRRLGGVRVGHTGTLDPLAQGVLVLLVGRATRLQDRFLTLTKRYEFEAEFGRQTDSGDLAGAVIRESSVPSLTFDQVHEALQRFVGERLQVPPRFSALKFKGQPYYRYARRGVDIPRAPRPIHISRFELLSLVGGKWRARVECSRGTYIRTLVEDAAQSLGTCAVLTSLVRQAVGPFDRREALPLESLDALPEASLVSMIQPVERLEERMAYA